MSRDNERILAQFPFSGHGSFFVRLAGLETLLDEIGVVLAEWIGLRGLDSCHRQRKFWQKESNYD